MKRPLDTALVLSGWEALEPPDGDAFSARVLAAFDEAVAPPRQSRRWPLYGALAVAGLLAPLLFVPRSSPSGAAPIVAHGPDLDLGLQTD
jgi:hypothetical protein